LAISVARSAAADAAYRETIVRERQPATCHQAGLRGVPSRAAGTVTRSPLVRTPGIAQILVRARQERSLDQPPRS